MLYWKFAFTLIMGMQVKNKYIMGYLWPGHAIYHILTNYKTNTPLAVAVQFCSHYIKTLYGVIQFICVLHYYYPVFTLFLWLITFTVAENWGGLYKLLTSI